MFALESAHGASRSPVDRGRVPKGKAVIVNMSGRGDKDLFITAKALDPENWKAFLLSEAETIAERRNG